ncbi:MAG: disulfide bond formation protein B [Methylococcales bacterium]|nr:disulfide bond formation protein B [Methylococcales bacterium]
MIKFNARIWFFLGFVSCVLMLSVGAFFQFIMDLQPCPLCISQRIAILFVGIIFLIAALHNPSETGVKVYACLGAIAALIGALVSGRHIWIQNMPKDQVPECGPGLSYIFDNFPLIDTLKLMLNGTGECAEVLWEFLGLSIPGWTLVAFIMLGCLSLLQYSNMKRKQST